VKEIEKLILFLAFIFAFHLEAGYDPTIQRWIQLDPIGEQGGLNLYGYVGNI
jgi:hypothetical protein